MQELSQYAKAYLITESFRKILGFRLIFLLLAVISSYSMYQAYLSWIDLNNFGKLEEYQKGDGFILYKYVPGTNGESPPDIKSVRNQVMSVYNLHAVIVGTGIGSAVVFYIFGRRNLRTLNEWQKTYLGQAYLTQFELNPPPGLSVQDRVVKAAAQIFPQLTYSKEYDSLVSELSKQGDAPGFSKEVEGLQCNVMLKTRAGHFVLLDRSQSEVNLQDVKTIVKSLKKDKDSILRVIVVARTYHESFSDPEAYAIPDELENLPMDFLEYENGHFHLLWIN